MGFSFVVLIQMHPPHLCYTRLCQEDMRLKDLKTFSQKKSYIDLDMIVNVIYVTRITTGATIDFVDVPVCNPLFGQATPTHLIGESKWKLTERLRCLD